MCDAAGTASTAWIPELSAASCVASLNGRASPLTVSTGVPRSPRTSEIGSTSRGSPHTMRRPSAEGFTAARSGQVNVPLMEIFESKVRTRWIPRYRSL